MSRFSRDPRVTLGAHVAVVGTPEGPVQVVARSEGGIHRWVAPYNRDGSWSALDTFYEDRDDAIDAVLQGFGGGR